MPTLKNCEKCGKVFNAEGTEPLCPECNLEEKKDLKRVNDFLRDNPMANVMDVHAKTGVSQAQIYRYVKEGNLKIRDMGGTFKCRLCGKDIKKGILCDDCRGKVEGMQKKKGK
jgi:Zn finger protein HypA/HybF involved in hydrogenase expression